MKVEIESRRKRFVVVDMENITKEGAECISSLPQLSFLSFVRDVRDSKVIYDILKCGAHLFTEQKIDRLYGKFSVLRRAEEKKMLLEKRWYS